jgi:protein-glutamine gamma-glutamyltransferase
MLDKLKHLPRDARDVLFLLCVIAWVILPQVSHLPIWCSVLAAGVLLWRGKLAWDSKSLPSVWWRMALLAATIAATFATHKTLLGRDAGVTLIVVLLCLKTLELRARRDAFVIFFLGFFTMLSNFFFSQSLLTAAAMLLALMGLLTALVNAHMQVGKPPLADSAKVAGKLVLLGAPIMAVLFVLFPRLAPLWGIPSDALVGRTGLSNSMQVGTIASLALNDAIALRVKFEGTAPVQSEMYWRGPVLSSFDGKEWKPSNSQFSGRYSAPHNLQTAGTPIKYQVTLEQNNRPWIFVLDAATEPPKVPGFEVTMTNELLWLGNRPVTDIVRYSAQSSAQFRHGPLTKVLALQDFVALPASFNPRTLQMAADMRRDPRFAQADASVLVPEVLRRLRTGGYTYTLEPGLYGQHTADEFWFDKKEGFCEHIASSFVILMRALDVPARIVTGYQGGDLNTVDGFWNLRQSDAHAWAEVWQAGTGWQRVDPTGAVAPGRIGELQRLTAPQGVVATAFGTVLSPGVVARLRAAWEATNNAWNQWVLNYSQSKQLDLLKNVGFSSPSWADLSYLLIGIIVTVSLIGAAWTLYSKSLHDPWLRLLHHARKRLTAAGVASHAGTPPRALALLATTQLGSAAQAHHDWLLQLEAQRYAPAASAAASLATLRTRFAQLPVLPDAPKLPTRAAITVALTR